MARPLRLDFPGAIHHVTGRRLGSWQDGRERLFRDDRDDRRFLDRLEEAVEDFGVRLYLFCLVRNHFHLVFERPQANLSRFMQRLSTAYTVYFKLRHRRHGHLLDGRFKAKLVCGDEYLLRLSRYVHQNPVWVAGWAQRPMKERITRLRTYRWSSYPGYAGCEGPWKWVDEEPILAMMSGRGAQKRKAYRGFVESGLADGDDEFRQVLTAPGPAIGDEVFRQWAEKVRARVLRGRRVKQDVSFRRVVAPLPPEEVIEEVSKAFGAAEQMLRVTKKNSPLRAVAARFLVRYAGQTQRQVANWLGVGTGTAVGSQLQRLDQWEKEDRKLREMMERLERSLEARRTEAGGPRTPKTDRTK
jgi:REP-associated tyrosine transposase